MCRNLEEGARGFLQKVDGSEGHKAGVRDLEKNERGEGNQRSGYSDTTDVHWQEAGNSGVADAVEADTWYLWQGDGLRGRG